MTKDVAGLSLCATVMRIYVLVFVVPYKYTTFKIIWQFSAYSLTNWVKSEIVSVVSSSQFKLSRLQPQTEDLLFQRTSWVLPTKDLMWKSTKLAKSSSHILEYNYVLAFKWINGQLLVLTICLERSQLGIEI